MTYLTDILSLLTAQGGTGLGPLIFGGALHATPEALIYLTCGKSSFILHVMKTVAVIDMLKDKVT